MIMAGSIMKYSIYKNETIITKESYIRPSIGNLGIISDIDDTFLILYPKPFKNYTIYYLETSTQKSFEDVVPHFQALSSSGRAKEN
jgi:phosphatidate phosphatase APP1